MEWTRTDKYVYRSGDYTICAAKVRDNWRFVAYQNKQYLGTTDSAEAAREICEHHATAPGETTNRDPAQQ